MAYALKLGLKVRCINIEIQKIDNFTFKMFGIFLSSFQIENKLEKAWIFQKTFLLANISIKVVSKIFFLTFSHINIQLIKKNLPKGLIFN